MISSLEAGGAQSMLFQLVDGWKNSNDEHMIVSLIDGGSLIKTFQGLRFPTIELHFQKFWHIPIDLVSLYRLIKNFQPDVIQTWLYHADLIGGVVSKLATRSPVVWGIHHTILPVNTLKPTTFAMIRLNAKLSGWIPASIVCCSESALRTNASIGYQKESMIVIENGINIHQYRPEPKTRNKIRTDLGLPGNASVVGMFARFHPQKDHRTFLQAAAILHRKKPDAFFILAGENINHRNRRLQYWIEKGRLENNVRLLDLRSDISALFMALDLFTLSSMDGEAFPMILGEAMACGIPCVVTDVGEMPKMVSGVGVCVGRQNPQALAKAWVQILDLPEGKYQILAQKARQKAEAVYDRDDVCRKYSELYLQLIGGPGEKDHE